MENKNLKRRSIDHTIDLLDENIIDYTSPLKNF